MSNENFSSPALPTGVKNKWDSIFPHLHAEEMLQKIEPGLPSISRIEVYNNDGESEIGVIDGGSRELQILRLIIMIYEVLQRGQAIKLVREFSTEDTFEEESGVYNTPAVTLIDYINDTDFSFQGEDRDWPRSRLPRDLISFLSPSNLQKVTLTPILPQSLDNHQ